MKTLFALLLIICQVGGAAYLVRIEGWVSGTVFFIFGMIFIGLMARVYDLANRLWQRILGNN